jgi:hypothetical protein
MDLVGNAINAVVVGGVGMILAWMAKGKFEAIDRRFEAIERRIDRLEERFEVRMEAFQTSLDAMRSDLTQVALAVGVRPRAADH